MFKTTKTGTATLETIYISLQYQKVTRETIDLAKFAVPVQQSVPRPRVKYSTRKHTTPMKELAAFLHEIEIEVLEYGQEKAWHTTQIKDHILSKLAGPSTILHKSVKHNKWSIGVLRTRYNKGQLYDTQPKPYLLSLRYNDDGYILLKGSRMTYASFDDCYEQCLEYKIADPRFIEEDKLNLIRLRINDGDEQWKGWTVAPKNYIEERCEAAKKKSLFNCLRFPKGLERTS